MPQRAVGFGCSLRRETLSHEGLAGQREYRRAIEDFDEAIRLNSQDAEAFLLLIKYVIESKPMRVPAG